MVMVSAMTGLYYNMILAWALHYMFASFTSDLPFASCDNYWNSKGMVFQCFYRHHHHYNQQYYYCIWFFFLHLYHQYYYCIWFFSFIFIINIIIMIVIFILVYTIISASIVYYHHHKHYDLCYH